MSKTKILVSNSMIKTIHGCSTEAWLKTNGYSAKGDQLEAPLKCGISCHKAFEKWIGEAQHDDCVQAFLDDYRPYSECYLISTGKQANYWHENVAKILDIFFCSNPILAMPFSVVKIEDPQEMVLWEDSQTIYVVSDRSDAIVRMKDTGDLFSFENKTTKWIGEDWFLDYSNDSQITNHVVTARANGFPVAGVFLQVLAISKLPDALATTKTGKPIRCRIPGHGLQRDCWPNHVRWDRREFIRTEEDIKVWRATTEEALRKYETTLLAPDLADVRQEGIYGRCGRCQFLQFCKTHRRNWDLLTKVPREEGVAYSGITNASSDN